MSEMEAAFIRGELTLVERDRYKGLGETGLPWIRYEIPGRDDKPSTIKSKIPEKIVTMATPGNESALMKEQSDYWIKNASGEWEKRK